MDSQRPKNPYMYLFVREDLTPSQQIIQAAHAVDELNKKYPHGPGNFMVLCGATNETDLCEVSELLSFEGIGHHLFFESDIDSYTAIATVPLKGSERKPLSRFPLKQ